MSKSNSSRNALVKPITECDQDVLDQTGASDDLLKVWQTKESKALVPSNGNAGDESCPQRHEAIQLIRHLVYHMGMPEPVCFRVTLLLDTYCIKIHSARRDALDREQLCYLCVALVRLINKMDNGEKSNETNWVQIADQLRSSAGYPVSGETRKCLSAYEMSVLSALGGQINGTSADTWFQAFWTRLHVIASSSIAQAPDDAGVEWRCVCWNYINIATSWFAAGELAPRSLAICVFASIAGSMTAHPDKMRILMLATNSSAAEIREVCAFSGALLQRLNMLFLGWSYVLLSAMWMDNARP